jgi:hypothetical protein
MSDRGEVDDQTVNDLAAQLHQFYEYAEDGPRDGLTIGDAYTMARFLAARGVRVASSSTEADVYHAPTPEAKRRTSAENVADVLAVLRRRVPTDIPTGGAE